MKILRSCFSTRRKDLRSKRPCGTPTFENSWKRSRRRHSSPPKQSKPLFDESKSVEVETIADRLGVRLTQTELTLLRQKLDRDGDGLVSQAELSYAGRKALSERSARELCRSTIEMPVDACDRLGSRAITFLDYAGTALFAIVGTQIAGDCGMNIIGCSLVGCVAAMGGGTLNNLIHGGSSLLLGRPGVFWARNHKYFAVSLVASVVTFFAWPAYCRSSAEHYLDNVIGRENLEKCGSIGKDAFIAVCERDTKFLQFVRVAFPELNPEEMDAAQYFHCIDTHQTGKIELEELDVLIHKHFDNSLETYALDTAALAAFSVAAVHGAIGMGLHPMVAASSGVTICFGGLFRDVFCARDLAIAGQSYALATGSASTVYVLLRELALRGFNLPLIARIVLSTGTCIGLRAWEYVRGEPLLAPMHGRD
jgi:uncharacterized membrane protein YeiH